MARIVGIVFSGFAVRAYAAGLALYVGLEAAAYVRHVFGAAGAVAAAL